MRTFQASFFDESKRLAALSRLRDPLEELAKHVDFEMFRPTLTDAPRKAERKSPGGCKPFFSIRDLKKRISPSDEPLA